MRTNSWLLGACAAAATAALTTFSCSADDFESCEEERTCPPPDAGVGGGASGSGGSSGSAGSSGSCSPECDSTEDCCDGECIAVASDAQHCGACGVSCDAPEATTSCVDGVCKIDSCADGFVDCNERPDDGCEAEDVGLPDPPQLVAPMLGEYTGSVHADVSLKPRLRWNAPSNTGSCSELTYHVQIDDSCERADYASCAFASPEVDEGGISETRWSPVAALDVSRVAPVGRVYFWRVRTCENENRCSEWSEVRYLNVGRLRDDLTGDGFSEILALTMDGESDIHTHIVLGGEPLTTRPTVNIAANYDAFADARFVGDVNGDGFSDAIWAQPTFGQNVGTALLLGARDTSQIGVVPLVDVSAYRGVSAVGDWNGDGFDDFAVSDYSGGTPVSEDAGVRVYAGAAVLDFSAPLEITLPSGTTPIEFGNELEGGFDLNGDGFSDLAIMDGDDGLIHIVAGGRSSERSVTVSLATTGACNYYVGAKLARAGDMNGDGLAELAARCRNRILLYAGAPTPGLVPIWLFDGGPELVTYSPDIVGGYDLGQDGLADLVFQTRTGSVRTLMVFPGSETLSGSSSAIAFGGVLADSDAVTVGDGLTIGDHDGDGHADLVVETAGGPENLRWFSGGKTVASSGDCAQPVSSFDAAGNWCEAAAETIEGVYVMSAMTEWEAGSTFGHVLGR